MESKKKFKISRPGFAGDQTVEPSPQRMGKTCFGERDLRRLLCSADWDTIIS
jgi:hypothetical protein